MQGPAARWEDRIWTARGEGSGLDRLLRAPLTLLSLLYGAVVEARARAYLEGKKPRARVDARVIVVGNLTVGGSGKTPAVAWIASRLAERGVKAAVILRGYKGTAKTPAVVSDGRTTLLTARESGDEALMLARLLPGIPVVVGADRAAAARLAISTFGATHLILDDGFQHLRLERDVDLLVMDSRRDPAREHLLPRGPLREPVTAAARATALIFSRSRDPDPPRWEWVEALCAERPCFAMGSKPLGVFGLDGLPRDPHAPCLAFCGLGRPEAFFADLEAAGVNARDMVAFPDHHCYCPGDLEKFARQAQRAGAKRLLTTDKDAVKINPQWAPGLPLEVFRAESDFGDQSEQLINLVMGPPGPQGTS